MASQLPLAPALLGRRVPSAARSCCSECSATQAPSAAYNTMFLCIAGCTRKSRCRLSCSACDSATLLALNRAHSSEKQAQTSASALACRRDRAGGLESYDSAIDNSKKASRQLGTGMTVDDKYTNDTLALEAQLRTYLTIDPYDPARGPVSKGF